MAEMGLYEKLSKTIDRADYGHKAGKDVFLSPRMNYRHDRVPTIVRSL